MMEDKKADEWGGRVAKRAYRMMGWTFAWVASQALAVFGSEFLWTSTWVTVLTVVLNLVFGAGLIWTFIGWLNELDEMQKRIHLEALALALGVGVVGGLAFSLLDITNLISFDAEISIVVVAISLSYIGGIVAGTCRYR